MEEIHDQPGAQGVERRMSPKDRSYRMKKKLLVAVMSKKEEELREFFQELFARQIKRGSRSRTIPWPLADAETGEVSPPRGMEVFHVWEKEPLPLPPLPIPTPQVVVCALPLDAMGDAWLGFFKQNDYYLYLVCLDAISPSAAIQLDPITFAKSLSQCRDAPLSPPLTVGHLGEVRKQVRKNLKDFMYGWYFNRLKRKDK